MAKTPSYRLHRESGQGCTKIQGKRYYFDPHSSPASKKKFKQLLAEYFLSDHPGMFGVKPSVLTLAEAMDAGEVGLGFVSKLISIRRLKASAWHRMVGRCLLVIFVLSSRQDIARPNSKSSLSTHPLA